ncbi:MAG: polysaccharide lyase family 8 super-sandwich domain-containing protein, partial [Bacteroidota bacterium]
MVKHLLAKISLLFLVLLHANTFGQVTHNDIMEGFRASLRFNKVNLGATSTDPCVAGTGSSITLDAAVTADLATIQSDGSWTDIDYTDLSPANTWEPYTHLLRVYQFAVAYTTTTSTHFGSATLYDAIEDGLEFYYLQDPDCTNWWQVEIRAPRILGRILLFMRDGSTQLPASLENDILARLDTIIPTPARYTGANRIDYTLWHIYQGLLRDSAAEISAAVTDAYSVYELTTDEGIQHDFSYNQHGPQLYTLNYGEVILARLNEIATQMVGSAYEFSGTNLNNYTNFLLGDFAKVRRGEYTSFSVAGRQISLPGKIKVGEGPYGDAKIIDPANATVYQTIIDRSEGVLSPDSDTTPDNTYFYRSLFTSHSRTDYKITILGNSSRTSKTETGNNENIKGRFLSEGATNILINGDEYFNIFAVWEWNKIPGTTTPEYTGTDLRPPSNWSYLGSSTFSGGVSDGTYGAQVFHMDEYDTQAKKAWFLFDDEMVCLGTGINSTATEKIATTINQSHLEGSVVVSENNSPTTLSTTGEFTYGNGVDWVLHDSIGYFFPNGGNLKLSNQAQSGSWADINTKLCADTVTMDVFKFWFDHGTNPLDDSYAYIVTPGKVTTAQMQAYDMSNIKILQNSGDVQAVKNESLDMIQVVFYEPTTVNLDGITIGVDKACSLILKNVSTSNVDVYVSDPSETSEGVQIVWESPSITPMRKLMATLPSGTAYLGSTVNYTIDSNTPFGSSLASYEYTETFENMTLSDWGTETYTGDNGFSWTVNAKGESGHFNNGKNIYFLSGETGVTSGTIPGGIGSFEVQCLDLWATGNDRVIELLVNGNVVDTFTHNGTEIYTYTVNDINIEGDFTLAIRNASDTASNNTLVIDNISWNSYTPPPPTYDYTETLENMTLSDWGTETYTGDNGFIWNVDARGDSGRLNSGKNIYFQNSKTGITSGTIPGGIGAFSVQCMDLWSTGNDRVIELLINGNVVDTFTHNGTEIYTYAVNDINIEGDFTLAIRNASDTGGNNNLVIDNISWSSYAPPPPTYDYTETLENMTLSDWGTETYTGDNGFSWSVDAKGESGRLNSGKNIYFQNSKTGITSGTISGGIGAFSVQCMDLWATGNDRVIELLVNGNVVDTFTHNGTEIYTYTVNDINIEGDFTLAIRNASDTGSNNTLVIDNISWNSYTAPPPTYDYTETLENMTLSGWGTETYTGDNGFSWSVDARGESGRLNSGNNIYFHNSKTGITSGTISGGIGSFSVECMDLWSTGNDRVIELLVNGNVVDTFTHNGTEIYTYTVNDINIEGDFTLAIRNASGTGSNNTLVIDNISWNSYSAGTFARAIILSDEEPEEPEEPLLS